jgi:hypothetical protein
MYTGSISMLAYFYSLRAEKVVIAEELLVLDADAPLWRAARPLLDIVLRIEQHEQAYSWHGWRKELVDAFLNKLPPHCCLVLGVWEIVPATATDLEQEVMALGLVCEVVEGVICSIRTFEALTAAGLKPIRELEPGIQDALEIMRLARLQVAPVAWALFTDKLTWDDWLYADSPVEGCIDKAALLAQFARQGRCVLLGDQSTRSRA